MPSLTNLAILGHTPRFRWSFSRLTLNHSSVICELCLRKKRGMWDVAPTPVGLRGPLGLFDLATFQNSTILPKDSLLDSEHSRGKCGRKDNAIM